MHYVIGDIHCQIDALILLLGKLDLTPGDKVYFVGDWFDRAYTNDEYLRTMKWMTENLVEGSQFKSVYGNHDIDMMRHIANINITEKKLMEIVGDGMYKQSRKSKAGKYYDAISKIVLKFPLMIELNVNGKDYIITHSWLLDANDNGIGCEGFNKDTINAQMSIWDREYSWRNTDEFYPDDMPIIIHGHTTTNHHMKAKDFIGSPYSKIMKLGEHNINVDCGAARGVMYGGNLAAYRIEDGAEFYAYDDNMYQYMLDVWEEDKERKLRVRRYDMIFLSAFLYDSAKDVVDVYVNGGFNNQEIDNAVKRVLDLCGYYEDEWESFALEYMLFTNRVDGRAKLLTQKFWVDNKERILRECCNYEIPKED